MSDKFLGPLIRRIRLSLGRGIIKLVNDSNGIQKLQLSLMANETRSNIERFQEYGFTSVPKAGAEAAVIFMGGNRDHGIIVAVDDRRYRLKSLSSGEVALYTDEGDKIVMKRGNKIEVTTQTFEVNTTDYIVNASSKATFNTPELRVSGDIIDRYATNSDSLYGMRETFNIHTHPENDSGGPTDPPNQQMDT